MAFINPFRSSDGAVFDAAYQKKVGSVLFDVKTPNTETYDPDMDKGIVNAKFAKEITKWIGLLKKAGIKPDPSGADYAKWDVKAASKTEALVEKVFLINNQKIWLRIKKDGSWDIWPREPKALQILEDLNAGISKEDIQKREDGKLRTLAEWKIRGNRTPPKPYCKVEVQGTDYYVTSLAGTSDAMSKSRAVDEVERTLKGGRSHSLPIFLASGEFEGLK